MSVRPLFLAALTLAFAACCKQVPAEPSVPTTASSALSAPSFEKVEQGQWLLSGWSPEEKYAGEGPVSLSVNEGRFVGRASCNSYFVPFTLGKEPGTLEVGVGGSTKKLCPPAFMETERRFLERLSKVQRFGFGEEGTLWLEDADGSRLVFVEGVAEEE